MGVVHIPNFIQIALFSLNVLYVLYMPMDASLACWALLLNPLFLYPFFIDFILSFLSTRYPLRQWLQRARTNFRQSIHPYLDGPEGGTKRASEGIQGHLERIESLRDPQRT